MIETDELVWTERELYEHLVDLEGEKVNLRKALEGMFPLNFVHIHAPLDYFSDNLVQAGINHRNLRKRLRFEEKNFPHAKYETHWVRREFMRRDRIIDRGLWEVVKHEIGQAGTFIIGRDENGSPQGVLDFHFKENPTKDEIEKLLKYPMVDFVPMFHPKGLSVIGGSDNINTTRSEENNLDIYTVHTTIPHHIVDPSIDPKERVRIYLDKYEEKYGKDELSDYVSEEAPRIVNSLLANLV